MVDLKEAPEPLTPEQQGIENAKQTILIIEQLLFALNNATFPLRFSEGALRGAGFLQGLHADLIDKIGPEEVQKLREQHKTNVPPPPPPPKPPMLVKPDGSPAA